MKSCDTIAELRKQFKGINSGCAQDTIFMAKALMFLCETNAANGKRKGVKPSEWNRFFSRGMKAGKSPSQIAKEWKALKKK